LNEAKTMLSDNPDFMLVSSTFPMFGANIKRLWGSQEFAAYMAELVAAAQTGASKGFPDTVLQALMRLADLHAQSFQQAPAFLQGNEDLKTVSQSFPEIAARLIASWGRAEFGPYMTGLLHDKREEGRKGFPFETLMALHALTEQHNKDYGQLFAPVDMWSQSGG
jgi:hypothetical protein